MGRLHLSDCSARRACCQLAPRVFAFFVVAWLGAAGAFAQLPQARLLSLFPCGGKAGTTVELALTTTEDLDEAQRLLFNHPGITAVAKTHDVGGKQTPMPNLFEVKIRPDVPSGVYEVYADGLFGLSNPRIFVVGSQQETREAEPNNDFDKPNELVLNTIVNGTLGTATDVDCFRFQGKRGQHIVVTCRAADLDSRLSAVVELVSSDGSRLGYAREELRHDPMVDAVLPEDGTYFIKVHDFLFRGGPEYVYRLSAGVLPYIDYIMPPAGVAGTTGQFTLFGRNLPGGKPADVRVEGRPLEKLNVAISLPSVPPIAPAHTTLGSVSAGMKTVSWILQTPAGESNPVLIQLAPSVPVVEKEPNDTPAQAQPVSAPGEFAGRFQAPGDTDYFKFHADAGQVFYIDVFADRIGSLADPYLVVEQVGYDAKGVETTSRITSLDDDNTNIAPAIFDTRSDDPTYRFQARDTGTYRIQLRDRSFESRGDPRLVYHVSIRPEQPDFQLVVLPQYPKQGAVKEVSTWALGLRKGDSRNVQILVLRRDGFRDPIEVWAENLPPGVTCRGAVLASSAKTGELIFTAAENAPEGFGFIRVMGKARLSDRAKVAALAAAEEALKTVKEEAQKLAQVAALSARAALQADELVATLKEGADLKPGDGDLAKTLLDARSAAASTAKVARAAAQTLAAFQGKVAPARATQRAAVAALEIVHEAIPATIVWSAALDVPAVSRLGQSLALSVMKESAPFQLSTDVAHLEVNQSRQVLLPLTLTRRNGFDGDVALALVGATPASLDLTIKSFPKGKTTELVRFFVPRFERPGTVTLYWNLQAPVAYRRNPFAEERAKTEQAAAAKQAAEAAALVKAAQSELDRATKIQSQCAETLKQAKTQLAATTTRHVPTQNATVAVRNSPLKKDPIKKDAVKKETVKKDIAKNAPVKSAPVKNAVVRQEPVRKETVRKETVRKDIVRKDTVQLVAEAEAAATAAAGVKQKAAAHLAETSAKSTAAAARKAAADRELAEATKAAAPHNLIDFAPSTPILLTIRPAPIDLKAVVPGGGSLKKGGRISVKIDVRRRKGFTGPVTIGVPLPPGVKGIDAKPFTIPANKNDAVVAITADASATPGQLANMVVRAQMEYQGKAEVDAPISLKVVP